MKPLEKQPGLSEMLSAKTKTGPSDAISLSWNGLSMTVS